MGCCVHCIAYAPISIKRRGLNRQINTPQELYMEWILSRQSQTFLCWSIVRVVVSNCTTFSSYQESIRMFSGSLLLYHAIFKNAPLWLRSLHYFRNGHWAPSPVCFFISYSLCSILPYPAWLGIFLNIFAQSRKMANRRQILVKCVKIYYKKLWIQDGGCSAQMFSGSISDHCLFTPA